VKTIRKKESGNDNRDNYSYLAFARAIITVAPTSCHGEGKNKQQPPLKAVAVVVIAMGCCNDCHGLL
jgi:hypothetical protein